MFLENVTDDLSYAKYGADRQNDQQMSKILDQALEDVAVSRLL